MKTIEKILEVFFLIMVIILVFIAGSFTYSKYIAKDDVANAFGYTLMVVKSNSMVPVFEYGDKLIIKLNDSYEVGDIVTFKEKNYFVTHRVIEIKANEVTTKGDANNKEDAPISKKSIVGVVKKVLN